MDEKLKELADAVDREMDTGDWLPVVQIMVKLGYKVKINGSV